MKRTTLLLLLFLTACLQNVNSQDNTSQSDFYETDKIQDINITFERDNWRYMLDSLRFNGDGYLVGTVEINGSKFEGAGVQYRGTKSFTPGAKRNPFNIVLNCNIVVEERSLIITGEGEREWEGKGEEEN